MCILYLKYIMKTDMNMFPVDAMYHIKQYLIPIEHKL